MPKRFFSLERISQLQVALIFSLALVSGCGGSGAHLILEDQGQSAAAGGTPDLGGAPTEYTYSYVEDIQPIFEQRCSLCHPGATPDNWTLYEDASAKAGLIARRVGEGSMPPGNATQMTDEEREMVLIWVEEGAPRGE